MNELKHCPFCGGEAIFFAKSFEVKGDIRGWKFGVKCKRCGVTTAKTDYELKIIFLENAEIKPVDDERQLAADEWNRRVI